VYHTIRVLGFLLQYKPAKKGEYADLYRAGDPSPRQAAWVPPQSPYGLIGE